MALTIGTLSLAEIIEARSAGFTLAEIRELAGLGAETVVAKAPVKAAKAPKPNSFYAQVIAARVPCAHGVAACGFFAPNGAGKTQHSTCPKGRKAMKAAR